MADVRLEHLRIELGRRAVVEDFSLEVAHGEFLVLLGPSGCGKSTLLNTIAGLTDVAAGRVMIGGEDVTGQDPAARNIGMVFQSYALYPGMTVEKNLSFGLRVRGTARDEIHRRVTAAAELLQLTPLLGRRPAALSGGQRQRVAIGRALVRDARVYLFDEPLSNLDANLRTTLRRELKDLHRRLGATMIFVTHDQIEALTLATRIAVMDHGVLQQVGTPDEVYGRPVNRFVAGFLGNPPMNFVDGTLSGSAAAPLFDGGGLVISLDSAAVAGAFSAGRPVTLGLRPEQVHLGAGGLAGRVVGSESIGAARVVALDAGGTTLAALVPVAQRWPDGAQVPFSIDAAMLSLFDPIQGNRL
jgi:multiple sugar transport system ATP-binding protein